jgi:cytochrome c551/c552
LTARIILSNLRQYYIHKITLQGIRETENSYSLVHPTCYYTLNQIPDGGKLSMKEVNTKNSAADGSIAASNVSSQTAYDKIKPLLIKNTCIACHNPDKRQVGPGFIDVAKRNYSVEKIMQLIKNPQPKNWPDYSTPMTPMPQVSPWDARQIAQWINSLNAKK